MLPEATMHETGQQVDVLQHVLVDETTRSVSGCKFDLDAHREERVLTLPPPDNRKISYS